MSQPEKAPAAAGTKPSGESGGHAAVLRRAGIVSGAIMLSRLLGAARDVASAHLFGAGWVWDAFAVAFQVPNLFRKLFGEGALSVSFVPVFAQKAEKEGRDAAARALGNVAALTVVILSAITVVVVAAALLFPVDLFFGADHAGGEAGRQVVEQARQWRLTFQLVALLLPFMIFICLSAVLSGALNVLDRFLTPALGPVFLNLFWIAGATLAAPAVGGSPEGRVFFLSAAIMAGVVFQTVTQVLALRRLGVRFFPSLDRRSDAVRQVARKMAPATFGASIYQVNALLETLIARLMVAGEGAVSALYYASHLMQYAPALVGNALGTALLPTLARQAARGDRAAIAPAVARSAQSALFLVIPASVGLILVREPVVQALFHGGEFSAAAASRTADAVFYYSLGIGTVTLNHVLRAGFYAVGDTKTPVRAGLISLGVGLVASLLLVRTGLRESGLALSSSISSAVALVALAVWFGRAVGRAPLSPILATAWRAAAASVVMWGAVEGARAGLAAWPALAALAPRWRAGVEAGALVAAGAVAYFLSAAALGLNAWPRRPVGRQPVGEVAARPETDAETP
ncbi:MAG: murein biosynthesis integral membrane protein MurJ [Planctomycetes bacterium]|nr:murein biosynthesis integral membrane protein MurJ [Planctomycetota bacterium]